MLTRISHMWHEIGQMTGESTRDVQERIECESRNGETLFDTVSRVHADLQSLADAAEDAAYANRSIDDEMANRADAVIASR